MSRVEVGERPLPRAGAANREVIIEGCLARLEQVLAEEKSALREPTAGALRSVNERKSAILLELDRASRTLGDSSVSPQLLEQISNARKLLQESLDGIKLHLTAINEIMRVIRQSVERSEADGTYTRNRRQDEWLR